MIPRRAAALLLAGLLAAAATLVSAPSSRVAWTLETVRRARSGDAARGRKLHEDCAACHGDAGNADIPDVPDLGGQNPLYIYKQLADYKAETRASSIMNEAVKPLSERNMADLAAFYAAQAPPKLVGTAPPTDPAIVKLVSVGDGIRLIPACDACHGDRGAGNSQFYGMPVLKNQKLQDIVVQLRAYRSGERANDVYRVMRDAASKLSDAEIAGLAAYYSGGHPSAAPAPAPAK
ncbi:MAG TPA: c-type cytochrome [Thermoanaerobaculia bacterium]|nr:c-type cytochrome [Thermoanaerobaculia bacterium]